MAAKRKSQSRKVDVMAGKGSYSDMLKQRRQLISDGELVKANKLARNWRKKNGR